MLFFNNYYNFFFKVKFNMNSFNFNEFEKNFLFLPKIIKKNQINLIKENNVKNNNNIFNIEIL